MNPNNGEKNYEIEGEEGGGGAFINKRFLRTPEFMYIITNIHSSKVRLANTYEGEGAIHLNI